MKRDLLNVLRERDALSDADRKTGRARVGGSAFYFNVPQYAQSYVLASRALIDDSISNDRLQAMAMPCLYLLRHALELTLKDILAEVYGIRDMTQQTVTGEVPVKAPGGHDLGKLFGELVAELNALRVKMPKTLSNLVDEINTFEDGDPTRSRYGMGKQGKYKAASFPDEAVIPLLEWQQKLERIWAADLSVRYDVIRERRAPKPITLAETLARKGQRKFEALSFVGIWSRYPVSRPR